MAKLGGTIQNDMLKEFIAQKEWIVPPRPAMRIVTDMIEFCSRAHAALEHGVDQRLPHPRSRSDGGAGAGLHARRRHRLRRGVRQARAGRRRRSPRGSRFFLDVHNDFFEEIAKFRAARRIWARRHERALRREERRDRCSCARTRRPPACRSRRSSRTTTWCASRSRRWRRCSAARSRCTPTRSTRPTRCPPRRR